MQYGMTSLERAAKKKALQEARNRRADALSWCPDGMSWAEFESHPVRQLLRDAAYFGDRGLPSRQELAELQLPDDVTRQINAHAQELAAIHNSGNQQPAWELSKQLAAELLESLPRYQQAHPDTRADPAPDPLDGFDPSQLADLIRPGYSALSTNADDDESNEP